MRPDHGERRLLGGHRFEETVCGWASALQRRHLPRMRRLGARSLERLDRLPVALLDVLERMARRVNRRRSDLKMNGLRSRPRRRRAAACRLARGGGRTDARPPGSPASCRRRTQCAETGPQTRAECRGLAVPSRRHVPRSGDDPRACERWSWTRPAGDWSSGTFRARAGPRAGPASRPRVRRLPHRPPHRRRRARAPEAPARPGTPDRRRGNRRELPFRSRRSRRCPVARLDMRRLQPLSRRPREPLRERALHRVRRRRRLCGARGRRRAVLLPDSGRVRRRTGGTAPLRRSDRLPVAPPGGGAQTTSASTASERQPTSSARSPSRRAGRCTPGPGRGT